MLFIISQDSELIELDLNAGDTLVISYSGYGTQTANARTALLVPVDFLILDPTNEPLLEASGLVENFVDVEVEISGIHRLVFINPDRLQSLVVPVDYYSSPSTAAPTAMATPAPTVNLDSSTDPGSATPLTEGVSLSTPRSGSEELFIPSKKSELIELSLNAGDTLKVSYFTSAAVIGTSTASPPPPPIEFLILDPTNEPLLEVGGLGENFVDVQVEISGTHGLVFTNPARLQGRIVSVDYYIVPSTADPTAMATPAPTVSLDGSTDSNSTTPSTQAASLCIPVSGRETLFIPGKNFELIELDLNAGDTLKVTYFTFAAVIGTSTASPPASPIEFIILDPANEPLLEVGALEENSVEVRVEVTGTHQLVFTNPTLLQGLEVPVEYAITPRAAAPTATPIPASTVSLDGNTDSGSATPLTQAASLSIPFSGDEILFIPSQNTELFQLELNAGDTLKVSYFTSVAVIGTSTASPPPPPVDFRILDPANEPLLEASGLVENFVDVEVEISGIHRLVFTNPDRLQSIEVLVEYAINP